MPYYIVVRDELRRTQNIIPNGFFSRNAADKVRDEVASDYGHSTGVFVQDMTSTAVKSLGGEPQKECQKCKDWVVLDDFLVDMPGGQDESSECSDCRNRVYD